MGRHLKSPIPGQYFDDLPVGSVMWWDESLYARTGDSRTSGTSTDNIISRSNCQSADPPMLVVGDTNPDTNNATFARSSTESYYSTYSWKFTQTGDTDCRVTLGDTFSTADLHGLTAGTTYFIEVALYFSSTSTIDPEKVYLTIQDYYGNWEQVKVYPRAVYNQWQILSVEKEIRAGATGISAGFYSGDTSTGYFYVGYVVGMDASNKGTMGDTSASFSSTAIISDIVYDQLTGKYGKVLARDGDTRITLDEDALLGKYVIYPKPSLPDKWVIIDGRTISDDSSPFNGITLKDWITDNRYFRTNSTSSLNGLNPFADGESADYVSSRLTQKAQAEAVASGTFNYVDDFGEDFDDKVTPTISNRTTLVPIIKIAAPGVVVTGPHIIEGNLTVTGDTSTFNEVHVNKDFYLGGSEFDVINHLVDGDDLFTGTELFELNTPDCPSSLGRMPMQGQNIVSSPAKITEQGVETYDNAWNKWTNRSCVGVFKATTNLVSDPEDMTTGNWTNSNSTDALSDYYLGGRRFTLVTTTANWGDVRQTVAISGAFCSITATLRVGTSADCYIGIYDATAPAWRGQVQITWATEAVVASSGLGTETIHSAKWIKANEIVEVRFSVDSGIVAGNTNKVIFYASNLNAKTAYLTAVQVEDSTYPTPYTSTSRAAGALAINKSMPNAGTIECWVRPWFDADTAVSGRVFSWALDASHRLQLWYYAPSNAWTVIWRNGAAGTSRYLNGTTVYTNATLWNWIHLKVWWNISAGTGGLAVNGSTEDATWSGALDAFTTPIETLAIGFEEYTDVSHFDGLITDFAFKDTVDTSTTHYDSGRPYYEQGRLLGKNCNWRLG